jgi:hypothetical protein
MLSQLEKPSGNYFTVPDHKYLEGTIVGSIIALATLPRY